MSHTYAKMVSLCRLLHLQVLHQVISQAGQPVPEIPVVLLKALVPGTKSLAAGQHCCALV